MAATTTATEQLTTFHGQMTSLDRVLAARASHRHRRLPDDARPRGGRTGVLIAEHRPPR